MRSNAVTNLTSSDAVNVAPLADASCPNIGAQLAAVNATIANMNLPLINRRLQSSQPGTKVDMVIMIAPSDSSDLRTNARAYLSALNVFFNVSTSEPTTLLNMSLSQSMSAAVQNYASTSGIYLPFDSILAFSDGPAELSGLKLDTPPAAPASNQPLVIGLSVTFSILFVVALVALFIYRRRRSNRLLNSSNRHMLSSESFEGGVPMNPLWAAKETKSREQADAFMEFPGSEELDEFGGVNPMLGRSIGVQTTFSTFNVDSLAPNALPSGVGDRFDFNPTSSALNNGASKRQLSSQKSFSSTLKRFFFSSNTPFSTRGEGSVGSQPSQDLSALATPSTFSANPIHALRLTKNGGMMGRSMGMSQSSMRAMSIFNTTSTTNSDFQNINPMREKLTARSDGSIGALSPSRRAVSSDLDSVSSPPRRLPSLRAMPEEEEEEGEHDGEIAEEASENEGNKSDDYDEEIGVGMSPRKLQHQEEERDAEEPVSFSPQITPSRQKSKRIMDLASNYEKVILERKNSSYLPANTSKSSTIRMIAAPASLSPWYEKEKKSTRFLLPVNQKVVEPIHEVEEEEEVDEDVPDAQSEEAEASEVEEASGNDEEEEDEEAQDEEEEDEEAQDEEEEDEE
jgi:hypothetical protein